jgi:hypothetical protein
MTSFANKKQLKIVVTLGTKKFGSSDHDRVTLTGFRAAVTIDKAGGVTMSTLRAKIYGVKQQDMNSITTLQWKVGTLIPNTVEVFAIDGDLESRVFAGNIVNAWADYQNMPDVFLHIQAQSAYFDQLKSIPPRSFKGSVDVAITMKQIADGMGLAFENNGVDIKLTDVYLPNTATEQMKELAKAANIDVYLDDSVLAIAKRYGPRSSIIPVISANSGLVGYPTFDGTGVNFKSLFNPNVTFGGLIQLETDVEQARGQWIVTSVAHQLESEKPGGAWFTTIRGNLNGYAITK